MRWIILALLSAWAMFSKHADAGAVRTVSIPVDVAHASGAPKSCTAADFDLHHCLAQLIESKTDPKTALEIAIKPGQFKFESRNGLLIFQRPHVSIRGSSDPNHPTRIEWSPKLPPQHRFMGFFAHVVNSSDVRIADLELIADAAEVRLAALGVCHIDEDPSSTSVDHVTLERVTASGFKNFFVIVGNSVAPDQFFPAPAKTIDNAIQPALSRLFAFIGKPGEHPNRQVCGGDFSDLIFQSNTVAMQSVAFYLAPLLLHQTQTWNVWDGINLRSAKGTSASWLDVVRPLVTARNHGVLIKNNRLTVDSRAQKGVFGDQLTNYMHSAIKIQGTGDVTIEGNTIDASSVDGAFANGAAINVASFSYKSRILANTIKLRHSTNALAIQGYFSLHGYFGIGAFDSYESGGKSVPLRAAGASDADYAHQAPMAGKLGIFGPVLGEFTFEGNHVANGYATFSDCTPEAMWGVSGAPLMMGPLVPFVTAMASAATFAPNDSLKDRYSFRNNDYAFDWSANPKTLGTLAKTGGVAKVSNDETYEKTTGAKIAASFHPAGAPPYAACRRDALTWTATGNTLSDNAGHTASSP